MQYFLEICKDQELSEEIVKSMKAQVDYLIGKIGDTNEGKFPITKAMFFTSSSICFGRFW